MLIYTPTTKVYFQYFLKMDYYIKTIDDKQTLWNLSNRYLQLLFIYSSLWAIFRIISHVQKDFLTLNITKILKPERLLSNFLVSLLDWFNVYFLELATIHFLNFFSSAVQQFCFYLLLTIFLKNFLNSTSKLILCLNQGKFLSLQSLRISSTIRSILFFVWFNKIIFLVRKVTNTYKNHCTSFINRDVTEIKNYYYTIFFD